MGNFMGQDTTQLIVIGPAQETRGDIELTVAGVSRIDLGLIDDADSDLIEAIRAAVDAKPKGHDFHIERAKPAVARHMSTTGG